MTASRSNTLPYLWHYVPDGPLMPRSTLLPPSILRSENPALARAYNALYTGDTVTGALMLPRLSCCLDDTLLLSPVHPHLLHRAMTEAGHRAKPLKAFQIPVGSLHGREAIWIDPVQATPMDGRIPDNAVHPFDPSDYTARLPSEDTFTYYREEATAGRPVSRFAKEPHVLVRAITHEGQPWPLSARFTSLIDSTPPTPWPAYGR